MQNFYLLRWLKERSGVDPEIVDLLKFALDKRIYHYGDQFINPAEKNAVEAFYWGVRAVAGGVLSPFKNAREQAGAGGSGVKIASHAYFGLNAALVEQGFEAFQVPWHMSRSDLGHPSLFRRMRKIASMLESADFKDLLTKDFAADVRHLRYELKEYFLRAGIAALVVPYDLPFFERLSIKLFKELNRPSFISLHGLAGRYNHIDDNRTDYLLVWGGKIKEFYVRAGIPQEKIFVTGHPSYREPVAKKLRFALDDVLVISKSMCGAQHSAEEILSDRGNLPLYLYSVRKVLERAGVKRARLRLHPSESGRWYARFIGADFYTMDRGPLSASLASASLVVGPTSTVFVESLVSGVNYLVYEPEMAGLDLVNYPLVPPFDGTEPGIPTAHNEDDLHRLLSSRAAVDPASLSGYIRTPFDISFLADLIPGL